MLDGGSDLCNDAISASRSEAAVARSEIMGRVRAKYVHTDRDTELEAGLDFLIDRILMAQTCGKIKSEARALVVVGESGAGKTTALHRLFSRHPAFPNYKQLGCQLVTVRTPSPCTLMQLGRETLRILGYPLVAEKKQHIIWEMVRAQLARQNVRALHFDEVQNVTEIANVDEAKRIRDTFKSFLNDTETPICLILSGLPSLVEFLQGDPQNRRRSRFVELKSLSGEDVEPMKKTMIALANVAGLILTPEMAGTVAPRLFHAGTYQFGIVIELIHETIDGALRTGISTLTIEEFAAMFAAMTGNSFAANPFLAANWPEINCGSVLRHGDERMPAHPKPPQRRRKAAELSSSGRTF